MNGRDLPAMRHLLDVMARLRDPESGCPWDLKQDFATIAPYTIEEAHEVADVIERKAWGELRGELGDLLFQVVFHARMAEERGFFAFDDVAAAIAEKMISRHPHVFAGMDVEQADAVVGLWESRKEEERRHKAEAEGRLPSELDDVARGLPALLRALKLQKRAARVGFDWDAALPILDKIEEEIAELRSEILDGRRPAQEDELGDLIFGLVNLARHLDHDPEAALRRTNTKFERRFRWIEQELAKAGKTPKEATLEEMEDLWQQAKTHDPSPSDPSS